MLKAARESQVHTTWINQDESYEAALSRFVRQSLAPGSAFLEDIVTLRDQVAHVGAFNALSQQLLKLTAPGVPDLYQGTELWDQSLVDPDNRRPVDYTAREAHLRNLQSSQPSPELAAELLSAKEDGRIKLFLTAQVLASRNAHKALYTEGAYLPLEADGTAADHLVAFARRLGDEEVIVAAPRLVAGLVGRDMRDPIGEEIWSWSRLLLPDGEPGARYCNLLTNEILTAMEAEPGAALQMGEVFAHLPVALLERIA